MNNKQLKNLANNPHYIMNEFEADTLNKIRTEEFRKNRRKVRKNKNKVIKHNPNFKKHNPDLKEEDEQDSRQQDPAT